MAPIPTDATLKARIVSELWLEGVIDPRHVSVDDAARWAIRDEEHYGRARYLIHAMAENPLAPVTRVETSGLDPIALVGERGWVAIYLSQMDPDVAAATF